MMLEKQLEFPNSDNWELGQDREGHGEFLYSVLVRSGWLTCGEGGGSRADTGCRADCWSESRTPWGRCNAGSGRWRTSGRRGRTVSPAGSETRIYVSFQSGSLILVVFIMKLRRFRVTRRLGEWNLYLKLEDSTGFIRGERDHFSFKWNERKRSLF